MEESDWPEEGVVFYLVFVFGRDKFALPFLVRKANWATFPQSLQALAICQAGSVWVGEDLACMPAIL